MKPLLLLYDTDEQDLARDIREFLLVHSIPVDMIPLSPDVGSTLQEKEATYLSSCSGAVFLLTPGCERHGVGHPSPSLADEMGQFRHLFRNRPESVIYLLDSKCQPQAIDQKGYIKFESGNMRSVVQALTQLIRNLQRAGLTLGQSNPRTKPPSVDIAKFASGLSDSLKALCSRLCDSPNGAMISGTFEEALKNPSEMALSEREANFLKRDLQIHGLASYDPPKPPYNVGVWRLSNLGFELVRYETELAAKARVDLFARISSYRAAETMKTLTEFLDKPGLSQEVCNRPQAAAL